MTEINCYRCKRWKGCIGKDWYNYGEIRWCPLQVMWILQHVADFVAGIWPSEHKEAHDSRQFHPDANFVNAKLIYAELKERLDMIYDQGELLITQIEDGRTFQTLSPGAMEILMYVKGSDRKKIGFKRWIRECYHKPITVQNHQYSLKA